MKRFLLMGLLVAAAAGCAVSARVPGVALDVAAPPQAVAVRPFYPRTVWHRTHGYDYRFTRPFRPCDD